MKRKKIKFAGINYILVLSMLLFLFGAKAQRPSEEFVVTKCNFDTTATHTIYQRKYLIAGKYFILASNVNQIMKQKLQGKEVEISGSLSYIQGKTLIGSDNKMYPAKDFYSIIDDPCIELTNEQISLE